MENVKRGQIYYADLGQGIGSEQGGKRPVLILQNDIGNKYSTTTIVAPLTTQAKTNIPTHREVIMPSGRKSIVLLEQVRVIDKERLQGRSIGRIKDMSRVDKALMISLGLAETRS